MAPSRLPGISPVPAVSYRDMVPEDAHAVATCFYRTYGFTAPVADEVVYHPDKFAALAAPGFILEALQPSPTAASWVISASRASTPTIQSA